MPKYLRLCLLLMLLVVSVPLMAQDAETTTADAETEANVIPYFSSSRFFNVPVLTTWEDNSAEDRAWYVNPTYDVAILTTTVESSDTIAAIAEAVAVKLNTELPDAPIFEDTVALPDGRWRQFVYEIGDNTLNVRALTRDDRTYVISLYEANPNGDIYTRIIRNTDLIEAADADADTDTESSTTPQVSPDAGVELALQTFITEDFSATPDDAETLELSSGTWVHRQYSDVNGQQVDAFGFVFGSATHTTVVTGGIDTEGRVANALNTTFLGFFVTPDNANFLYLGLGAVAFLMFVLIGSIFFRYGNAQKDAELVQQLAEDD